MMERRKTEETRARSSACRGFFIDEKKPRKTGAAVCKGGEFKPPAKWLKQTA